MELTGRPNPHIERAANMALRRGCAAFRLDATRVTVSVETVCPGQVEIMLRYWMDGGNKPFLQRRHLSAHHRSTARATAEIREAFDEMMFNVAAAFRPAHAEQPVGRPPPGGSRRRSGRRTLSHTRRRKPR